MLLSASKHLKGNRRSVAELFSSSLRCNSLDFDDGLTVVFATRSVSVHGLWESGALLLESCVCLFVRGCSFGSRFLSVAWPCESLRHVACPSVSRARSIPAHRAARGLQGRRDRRRRRPQTRPVRGTRDPWAKEGVGASFDVTLGVV